MMYPSKRFVRPKELQNVTNGMLPAHLLSNVKPFGQLYWKAGAAWSAMLAAAKKDGLEFSHVGMYRSLAEQEKLFKARYSKKPTGRKPEILRAYKGETWYLRKGMAPAATPGRSNHGFACAVDISALVNGKVVSIGASRRHLDWLIANAGTFGWCWEVGDPRNPEFEIWHLICWDCDSLPASTLGKSVDQATKVKKPTRQERKGRKNKMAGEV